MFSLAHRPNPREKEVKSDHLAHPGPLFYEYEGPQHRLMALRRSLSKP
jgi:hypothetical protein